MQNPRDMLDNPNLLFRIGERYFDFREALPIIIGKCAFG